MRVSDFSTLWTPKLDSVGGSYNGQLSHLHQASSFLCITPLETEKCSAFRSPSFQFAHLQWIIIPPTTFPLSPTEQKELDTFLRENLARSEEHTSELQSLRHLVCRLLLEKKKIKQ